MQKSQLVVEGNTFHLSMPFAKVDKEHRLVSGFATLDNIDTQGDVVMADASAKAFARARGNIREMHQPIAAGKMVDFREDEYYDKGEKKFYRGIFVTARISKGAQDTWEKVLDGTLSGFSIGGEVNEADNEFSKEAGKTVRMIKDYDLVELSLVDNPANQLANVVSFQKSATGSVTVSGMAVETEIKNVFVCPKDETFSIKNEESDTCPTCGQKMETAGWFEEGPDRAEKVDEIVTKFLSPPVEEAAPSEIEGGVEMGLEDNVEEVAEAEVEEAVEVEEVAAVEEVEELSVEVEEVTDEEAEISKKIDDLHKAIEDSLADTKGEFSEQVEALKKFVEGQVNEIVTKTSELESKMNEYGEKLSVEKGRLDSFEQRLEKMNSADALRKSGDLVEEPGTTVQKNTIWSPGAFSGKSDNGFSVTGL